MNEDTRTVMRQWTLAQPVVSAFITSIVRDFTDRDDVLQDTAVAVLESSPRYDSARPFLAWALGIAQNQIRLYLRRCSRDRLLLDEGLVEIVAASFERVSSAEHLRQLEYLRECLAGLEDRERQLFELRYAQDLKPAAMGRILEMHPNTVSKALQRIRDQLRECLQRRAAMEGPA